MFVPRRQLDCSGKCEGYVLQHFGALPSHVHLSKCELCYFAWRRACTGWDVYSVAVECVCFSSLFICTAWHFIFSLEDVEGFFACFIIIKFNVKIMGFGVGRKVEDTRGSANVTLISHCAAHNDALDGCWLLAPIPPDENYFTQCRFQYDRNRKYRKHRVKYIFGVIVPKNRIFGTPKWVHVRRDGKRHDMRK